MAKSETRDSVSRVLAVSSFVLSLFTFFYASLDERYKAFVWVGARSVNLGLANPPTVDIRSLPVTFVNYGNQPISIEEVSHTMFGLSDKPNAECALDKPPYIDPNRPLFGQLNRILRTVRPTNFSSFTVKPGESETRNWDFAGSLSPDAYEPDPGKNSRGASDVCTSTIFQGHLAEGLCVSQRQPMTT